MYMYDLEIIDEESFTRWKEEVNDEYPGKGKALFQVCALWHSRVLMFCACFFNLGGL